MNPLSARLWGKLLEPKTQVEPSRQPFSNQDLKQLIVPLFVEQLLAMLVGIRAGKYLSATRVRGETLRRAVYATMILSGFIYLIQG